MKKILKGSGVYLVLALTIFLVYWLMWDNTESKEDWSISKTIIEIEKGTVSDITIKDTAIIDGKTKDGKTFKAYMPFVLRDKIGETLYAKAAQKKINLVAQRPQQSSILSDMLPMLFTVIIFAVLWFLAV